MMIATFNVENLFNRAKALNEDSAESRTAIKSHAMLS
jgi:hypothetical protein